MEFNSLIFKPPKCSIEKSSLRGSLVWIPAFVPDFSAPSLTEFHAQSSFSLMNGDMSRNLNSSRAYHAERELARLALRPQNSINPFSGTNGANSSPKKPENNQKRLENSDQDDFKEDDNRTEMKIRQPYDFGPKIFLAKSKRNQESNDNNSFQGELKIEKKEGTPKECQSPDKSMKIPGFNAGEKQKVGVNGSAKKVGSSQNSKADREINGKEEFGNHEKCVAQVPRSSNLSKQALMGISDSPVKIIRENESRSQSRENQNRIPESFKNTLKRGISNQAMSMDSQNLASISLENHSLARSSNGLRLDLTKVAPRSGSPGISSKQEEPSSICFGLHNFPSKRTTSRMDSSRISRINPKTKVSHYIPCILHKPNRDCDIVMIYFHGNGEDIVQSKEIGLMICKQLQVYVLHVEYPGYSFYPGSSPSEHTVYADADAVYDFLRKNLGFEDSKILVLGRSLGSGPACHLGSQRKPAAVILVSGFTSIRDIISGMVGSKLSSLAKNQFSNIDKIDKINAPVLIIHGMLDQMIPVEHAHQLYKKAKRAELVVPRKMTHSKFLFQEDFMNPILGFLMEIKFIQKANKMRKIELPQVLFREPKS